MASKKGKSKKGGRKSAAKKPMKKAATRRTKANKSGEKRKPNAAFMKPMTPSSTLAAVIGNSPMPRTEVTSRLWRYIKKNNLQDKTNRRLINADDQLKDDFRGKPHVSTLDMAA